MANIRKIEKLLVANRGEIANRIIRGAKDASIATVAIYSDADRNSSFVSLADEAFALGGNTPAETYLNIEKILLVAEKSGANAVHPGYGFLSENADFAQAVIDAGLIWVGPTPEAIAALGDKVTARTIATEVGAPLVPGSDGPVKNADEAVAFAKEFGLPIAIKAAFGGGGRGMKVARDINDVAELFESATRESITAFGRGECFVERYLDKPRHVEAQVIADKFGKVIVVGTRDCSVQRRFQKLIEEAPAPYLTVKQKEKIYTSAKAICQKIGYEGAGTVEYLVGADGLVSFLEVNTRLQVEHPVSEETAGIDLVLQQFRIAEGYPLEFEADPEPRGHSFEFRINGEDPTKNFLPSPGIVSTLTVPEGPGVRFDSGIKEGDVISGQYDSMLAKLIITGENRENALARARRALEEFEISGITTVIPFDKAILNDTDFIGDENGFKVHTRWIETEWINKLEDTPETQSYFETTDTEMIDIPVEVDNKRVVVSVAKETIYGTSKNNVLTDEPQVIFTKPKARVKNLANASGATGDKVVSPMQGTIVKIAVEEGQEVKAGDLLAVVEAMKMENPVNAHKYGKVTGLAITVGDAVTPGNTFMELKD